MKFHESIPSTCQKHLKPVFCIVHNSMLYCSSNIVHYSQHKEQPPIQLKIAQDLIRPMMKEGKNWTNPHFQLIGKDHNDID